MCPPHPLQTRVTSVRADMPGHVRLPFSLWLAPAWVGRVGHRHEPPAAPPRLRQGQAGPGGARPTGRPGPHACRPQIAVQQSMAHPAPFGRAFGGLRPAWHALLLASFFTPFAALAMPIRDVRAIAHVNAPRPRRTASVESSA